MQIYNIKKRLSSLFVKFFYQKFWKQIKLFNYQYISRKIYFCEFDTTLLKVLRQTPEEPTLRSKVHKDGVHSTENENFSLYLRTK